MSPKGSSGHYSHNIKELEEANNIVMIFFHIFLLFCLNFLYDLSVDMFLPFFNPFFNCFLSLRPADIQASGGLISLQHSQNSFNTVQPAGPLQGEQNKNKKLSTKPLFIKLVASSQLLKRTHVQTA